VEAAVGGIHGERRVAELLKLREMDAAAKLGFVLAAIDKLVHVADGHALKSAFTAPAGSPAAGMRSPIVRSPGHPGTGVFWPGK